MYGYQWEYANDNTNVAGKFVRLLQRVGIDKVAVNVFMTQYKG